MWGAAGPDGAPHWYILQPNLLQVPDFCEYFARV